MGSDGTAFCTIVSKNYLSQARALAESLRATHPDSPFYVLLVDRIDGRFDPAREPFRVVEIEQLPIPDLPRFCFQYTVIELNTAAKPYFLEYLFRRHRPRKLVYLDPDILVLSRAEPLLDALDRHSIVLTPHMVEPVFDGHKPGELEILQAGTYNLGFLGLSDTPTTHALLKWWQERLYAGCVVDLANGYHVDQKWMDLVPGYFADTFILRDPGFNVAYWNLHGRRGAKLEGGRATMADGSPLYFFHFSGFDPDKPDVISKHQDRYSMADLGPTAGLFAHYRERMLAHGYHECKQWPYAFGAFDNGVRVPDAARRIYRRFGDDARRFGDPFRATGEGCFFQHLTTAEKNDLCPLYAEIHGHRPDLRQAFPDLLGRSRVPYLNWLLQDGAAQYKLDPKLLADAQAVVAAADLRRRKAVGLRYRRVRRPFGVNLSGYFRSEKGTGEKVRSADRALRAAGVRVALNNVIDPWCEGVADVAGDFEAANPFAVNLITVNADQVEAFEKSRGIDYFLRRYNVGYWSWELSEFPREWAGAFRYFDEVWVPSRFCQEAVAHLSPVPVRCVPHAIEVHEPPADATRASFGLPEDKFIFLFAFDYQSYLERKNPLALVEAFRRAFGDRPDVLLVLKSVHASHAPESAARLRTAAAGAGNICLMDGVLSRERMYGLLSVCDCFASLHRSEGFGLNLAEAMALGKPVLATAYSANAEFMTPANSLPVAYRLGAIERDSGPYKQGQVWAQPDAEHAAELMRRVVGDRDFARRLGDQARQDVRDQFSPAVVGRRIKGYLEALVRRPPRTDGLVDATLRQTSETKLARLWWKLTRGHYGTPPQAVYRAGRAVAKLRRLLGAANGGAKR